KHRLVLDLYPEKPADPLLALVEPRGDPIREMAQAPVLESAPEPMAAAPALPVVKLTPASPAAVAAKPKVDRLVIVAIDAGHGGEDPGARGKGGTREKTVTLAIARRLKARID